MKRIFTLKLIIILISTHNNCVAQFGESGYCNINVNAPSWSTDYDNEKRAVLDKF